eukprot:IDg19528t1
MNTEMNADAARETRPPRKVRFAVEGPEIGDYAADPSFDVRYPDDTRKLGMVHNNPLVPAGVALTAAVLFGGLFAFNRGSSMWSQRMMRARVLAQGATVAFCARTMNTVRAEPDNMEIPDSKPSPN